MIEIIKDRIAEVERKLAARRGVPGYGPNVEALETTLGELKRILALAEENNNV